VLSADERARAGRYRFSADGNAFIVRRGSLRAILARYINISPRDLEFSASPAGKLYLPLTTTSARIRFSLSYSRWMGVYVVCNGHEVGIDVEEARTIEAAEKISEEFFSAREVEMLQQVPREEYMLAFFNCWTRKEAYIKALGQGLSKPLDEFAVSLYPNETARLLWDGVSATAAMSWALCHFNPAPGFIGAVCVPAGCQITTFLDAFPFDSFL
jgi:4'-phosphopantetheinyl transferase